MLQELVYVSKHPQNAWKRREVAIMLIGQYQDDISMYAMKNQKYNLLTLLTSIVNPTEIAPQMPKKLQSLMLGRIFTTCTLIGDILNMQDNTTLQYVNGVMESAIETIGAAVPLSVRLAATRCLIKFLRKIPEESKPSAQVIEKGLKPLLDLLTSSPLECI